MSELGEARAWERLVACSPEDVARRSQADFVAADGTYRLPVFGSPIVVDPTARTFAGTEERSQTVLAKTGHFARLAILHYLLAAQPLPPTGRLIDPSRLEAGQFYTQGSHLLPLERIAARFADDAAGFLEQAARFGGQQQSHGDAAAELRPFPRVPITAVLWTQDDEFPARAQLLFDEACEYQLPPDILWSVAMMCGLVLLIP